MDTTRRYGSRGVVRFKPYDPTQPTFLPPSLGELIPKDHLVRFVSYAVDRLDLTPLMDAYVGGGASAYHPRMMLKVVLYGMTQGVYSSRKLARALREQIPFMWLAAGQQPDFRTINRFRTEQAGPALREIFASLLEVLIDEELITGETLYVDGTKMEANAGRYTFVWRKNAERYGRARRERIERLLAEVDEQLAAEARGGAAEARGGAPEAPGAAMDSPMEALSSIETLGVEWTSAEMEAHLERLEERLRGLHAPAEDPPLEDAPLEDAPLEDAPLEEASSEEEVSWEEDAVTEEDSPVAPTPASSPASGPKAPTSPAGTSPAGSSKAGTSLSIEELELTHAQRRIARKLQKLRTLHLAKLRTYEEQARICGRRSGYSKTDPEATFLRLKNGAFGEQGQLRPAYNVQLGTEAQFIVSYSLHQHANDTSCLAGHLEEARRALGRLPRVLVADAGYGREETYALLAAAGVGAVVPYPRLATERTRRYQQNRFETAHWPYDERTDSFTCPEGRKLSYRRTKRRRAESGYLIERRIYEATGCAACPFQAECFPKGKTTGNRRLYISRPLEAYRAQVRQRLSGEEGRALLRRRGVEVEAVFGQLKRNQGKRRFALRGLEKVTVELGLLALAHNVKKWWRYWRLRRLLGWVANMLSCVRARRASRHAARVHFGGVI